MGAKSISAGWLAMLLWCAVVPVAGQQRPDDTRPADEDYRVGTDDVLLITVFAEPELTGPFTVDNDGAFAYPLLGRITVEDLTVREVEALLMARLADGFLRNPQLNVEVLEYRSQNVYVLGEVRAPGIYPLTGSMSLIQVLVAAGSMSATAGYEVQIVRRTGDGEGAGPVLPEDNVEVEVTYLNLRDLQSGRLSEVRLQDGDTIYVPKAETFFVTGHVRSPGSFVWDRGITVLQAISLAGGLTDRGSNRGIRILRIVDDEQEEVSVSLSDQVQAGDTVVIRQRFF